MTKGYVSGPQTKPPFNAMPRHMDAVRDYHSNVFKWLKLPGDRLNIKIQPYQ